MNALDERVADLKAELELAGGWTDRYRQLVEWGEALEPLDEALRTDELLVSGCSSPLWLQVRAVDGVWAVHGASTGILAQALLAVVVRLFDGLPVQGAEAAAVAHELELDRNLSPTRALVFERMLGRVLEAR